MADAQKVESVALMLTSDEADFLAIMLCRVGGHAGKTHRYLADDIGKALRNAGHPWGKSKFYAGVKGTIECSDKVGTVNEVDPF